MAAFDQVTYIQLKQSSVMQHRVGTVRKGSASSAGVILPDAV